MAEQLDLWERTAEAVEASWAAADAEWKAIALQTVYDLARRRRTFIAEEVSEVMATTHPHVRTREPRALGAVMRRAQADGIIEATGNYVTTRRSTRNASPVRVWRSTLFKETLDGQLRVLYDDVVSQEAGAEGGPQ